MKAVLWRGCFLLYLPERGIIFVCEKWTKNIHDLLFQKPGNALSVVENDDFTRAILRRFLTDGTISMLVQNTRAGILIHFYIILKLIQNFRAANLVIANIQMYISPQVPKFERNWSQYYWKEQYYLWLNSTTDTPVFMIL